MKNIPTGSALPSEDVRYRHAVQSTPAGDPLVNRVAAAQLREQFVRDGYLVIHNAVPAELCEKSISAFAKHVKPASDYFLRHESSKYEKHVFTEHGFMKYPIMNIQDLYDRKFGEFTQYGLDILTHKRIQDVVETLFGESGRIIHTMFFDGNQETWAHRDSHYIDSESVGSMIGVWVAAEDIHPGAGRFYVYAGSHRVPTPPELNLDSIDPNSRTYKDEMAAWSKRSGCELVSPELKQGDILLWSSLTIHGSLPTTEPCRSRKSFTAHYIPQSHDYLWMRSIRGGNAQFIVNGVRVSRSNEQGPLMQAKLITRNYLQEHSPQIFAAALSFYKTVNRKYRQLSSRHK